jgi:hypothetical protein
MQLPIQKFKYYPSTVEFQREASIKLGLCLTNPRQIQTIITEFNSNQKPRFIETCIGDGNCFYRAVSFSIFQTQDYHLTIRKKLCDYCYTNVKLMAGLMKLSARKVKERIAAQRKDGAWATHSFISMTGQFFNCGLYVWNAGEGKWIENSSAQGQREGGLYLFWTPRIHYDAVVSLD